MSKSIDLNDKTIVISRTDSIGDVLLTLPICAWLKQQYPTIKLVFLGKGYTKPVVLAYEQIDEYLDWNDFLSETNSEKIALFKAINADAIIHVFPNKQIAALAKKAGIPVRVGTSHRLYHLLTCSHRVNFTRKNSDLHEAQLNHELLRPFGLTELPSLEAVIECTKYFKVPDVALPEAFSDLNNCVILHPKSQGSAREWPMESYVQLAERLLKNGDKVVFTGTEKEGALFRKQLPIHQNLIDTTGKLSLEQLMVVISQSKALVACSTGPLHIAGYYGVIAVGLYSPKRPIHPGRWKALGNSVRIVVYDESCSTCAAKQECDCIEKIPVESVINAIG